MTPQSSVFGVILLVLYLTTFNQAQRFNEGIPEDQDDSLMWENRLSMLTDDDLALLLERARPDFLPDDDSLPSLPSQPIKPRKPLQFPKLTKKQRQFGVNPAYQPDVAAPGDDIMESFNEQPVSKKDTPLVGAASADSEVALDPFAEDSKDKKASLLALVRGDSTVAQALEEERINDIYFTTIVAVSSALVAFAVVGAGICYHRYQKNSKAAEDVEYPAYGVTGNGRETSPTSADRKLAQNAQLYHYQHQKQQMLACDANNSNGHRGNGALSDNESDDDAEEGDYTVYECPGLAPTGEMEVRNPLFDDDSATPKADSKTNQN